MLEITGNFPAAKKEKRGEKEPTHCFIFLWGCSKSGSAFCNLVALSKDGPENCAYTSLELCFSHENLPVLLILREVTVCFADPEVNKVSERPVAAARGRAAPNYLGVSAKGTVLFAVGCTMPCTWAALGCFIWSLKCSPVVVAPQHRLIAGTCTI